MKRSQSHLAGSGGRRERAERILDITAELLQLHGYRRVTIDDVARRAGVGKGTVYLHWKTREALLWAVLQREALKLFERLAAALALDPELALPHRLIPAIFLEGAHRPLVRALLLSDSSVLGNLADAESVSSAQQELAENLNYLQMLNEEGVLRSDLTAAAVVGAEGGRRPDPTAAAVHILANVTRGFSAADELGEDDGLTLEERAELLAFVLRRALENDALPTGTALFTLNSRVIDMFTEMADRHREQLQRAF